MDDRVACVISAVESHTMGVLSTLEQVVRNLALSFVSVLKTYNNVCNQVSSMFLDLYQYLNIGNELKQVKSAAHSP
jgi:hypothetical protein